MATILQAVKHIVKFTDKQELIDSGYDTTSLFDIYMLERGNWAGFTQKEVTDYCLGLPSIAKFPFYNSDILESLEKLGVTRKTEQGKDSLIDQYWIVVGYVVYKRLEKEKNC